MKDNFFTRFLAIIFLFFTIAILTLVTMFAKIGDVLPKTFWRRA